MSTIGKGLANQNQNYGSLAKIRPNKELRHGNKELTASHPNKNSLVTTNSTFIVTESKDVFVGASFGFPQSKQEARMSDVAIIPKLRPKSNVVGKRAYGTTQKKGH